MSGSPGGSDGTPEEGSLRIVVVGDVHGVWDRDLDGRALNHLQPDLVLFVGDFGDEDVALVQEIADVPWQKAVILGNHDAWWSTRSDSATSAQTPALEEQIKLLGDAHVGFGRLDFPKLGLSVVGARPFSWGGSWDSGEWASKFYGTRYGIHTSSESAKKISDNALAAPDMNRIIVLGHNGPAGLGSAPDDICGKDWIDEYNLPGGVRGGDHGDEDLRIALGTMEASGLKVPLVVFGHMHHKLLGGQGLRKMLVVKNEVVHVNAAVVPREAWGLRSIDSLARERQFTVIELDDTGVSRVDSRWLFVGKDTCEQARYMCLYRR